MPLLDGALFPKFLKDITKGFRHGELGARGAKERQGENLGKDEAPSCPRCNALMDRVGYSFASQVAIGGVIYYCNNPVCSGGGRGVQENKNLCQPESGGHLDDTN